jgi:hypothetical protein
VSEEARAASTKEKAVIIDVTKSVSLSLSLINNNRRSSILFYRVTSKFSAKENSPKELPSLEQRNSPRLLRNASRPTAVLANSSLELLLLKKLKIRERSAACC